MEKECRNRRGLSAPWRHGTAAQGNPEDKDEEDEDEFLGDDDICIPSREDWNAATQQVDSLGQEPVVTLEPTEEEEMDL
jgi:hypothetical protein